jgi:phage terminase large subunit-like protein
VVTNSFGEIKVDKEPNQRYKRIDPVDAAIDAHVIAMKPATKIDLDESIGKFMDLMG